MKKKRILLLSGYDAASHRYWRNLLDDHLVDYEWTQIALADRHFSWRVGGNGFSFALQYSKQLNQPFDLLIATSMVDLNSLRGFIPSLAKIPSIVYFHENQFVYPLHASNNKNQSMNQANLINAQISSIYAAFCADYLVFNSQYNLTSFLNGAKTLLKRLPESIPKDFIEKLESKAEVIAVPIKIDDNQLTKTGIEQRPIEILWNHRWEYDKQPEVFFDAMRLLKKAGYNFKLHVLGQSFRKIPDCFAEAKVEFKQQIETFGYQPKQEYLKLLAQADIAVSSALHDFQGLSLLEAISYGCVPVAPNRVAYPEYVAAEQLYCIEQGNKVSPSSKNNKTIVDQSEAFQLYNKIIQVIDNLEREPESARQLELNKHQIKVNNYGVDCLIPRYRALIDKACS